MFQLNFPLGLIYTERKRYRFQMNSLEIKFAYCSHQAAAKVKKNFVFVSFTFSQCKGTLNVQSDLLLNWNELD